MYIKSLYEYFKNCNYTVSTDSRNCPKDSLFFALKGDNFDGNKYAANALENGAAYAVVDNPDYVVEGSDQYIFVHDTLLALQLMANFHRQMQQIPVIGITGTNGKTTTKELIAVILEKKYKVHYTKGNFNNHIGVPLTLLGIRAEDEIAVIEMGASHLGEIRDLARIAQPDYVLITNIGKAHIEGFGSFENILKTKMELYDYIKLNREGTVFLNNDDEILKNRVEGIKTVLTYGQSDKADICGSIQLDSLTLSIDWAEKTHPEKVFSVNTKLVGDYNLYNVLAAITIGVYFKVSNEDINEALTEYSPSNNRSQLVQTKKNRLIVDAYNANPTSMHAALDNFCLIKEENKAVILGDMKELGKESINEHQSIIDLLERHPEITPVILVGSEFGKVNRKFLHFADKDALLKELSVNPIANKTILIKGSNSTQLYKIVDAL